MLRQYLFSKTRVDSPLPRLLPITSVDPTFFPSKNGREWLSSSAEANFGIIPVYESSSQNLTILILFIFTINSCNQIFFDRNQNEFSIQIANYSQFLKYEMHAKSTAFRLSTWTTIHIPYIYICPSVIVAQGFLKKEEKMRHYFWRHGNLSKHVEQPRMGKVDGRPEHFHFISLVVGSSGVVVVVADESICRHRRIFFGGYCL